MICLSLLGRMKLSDWNLICIVVVDFVAFIFIGLLWISSWLVILLQMIRSILNILVFNMCDLRSFIKISINMLSRFLSWIIINIMIIDIEIISMYNKLFLLKTRRNMLILLKIIWNFWNISITCNVFVLVIIEILIFCHWWELQRLLLIKFFSLFYVEFRIFFVKIYIFNWLIIGACYVSRWIYLRLSMIFLKTIIILVL